jgi:hypothetical protein
MVLIKLRRLGWLLLDKIHTSAQKSQPRPGDGPDGDATIFSVLIMGQVANRGGNEQKFPRTHGKPIAKRYYQSTIASANQIYFSLCTDWLRPPGSFYHPCCVAQGKKV